MSKKTVVPGIQHGAMAFSESPADLEAVRHYRLARVRAELARRDYAGILLYDPINTRYATDSTNMQVWSMHNEQRYVLVLTDGPVVLFEGESAVHLSEALSTIDEIRIGIGWNYFFAGDQQTRLVRQWATEIDDLLRMHSGGNRRLAVDRCGPLGVQALAALEVAVMDGFEVMELAREIKSSGEISLMKAALAACEAGILAMHEALQPGITENQLWARLHAKNIELGGEWIETRLLASGPRTNPWYRECSHRVIQAGELVAFDTDLIGPYGYCADISRTWVCGDQPNDSQRQLHALAEEQLQHNIDLLQPGISLREFSERAWPIPARYQANRYSCIGHGVGLGDEYPSIVHLQDWDAVGYHGEIQANTTLCIESYIGESGGAEGVKLEQQLLVTDSGVELLSVYPLGLTR